MNSLRFSNNVAKLNLLTKRNRRDDGRSYSAFSTAFKLLVMGSCYPLLLLHGNKQCPQSGLYKKRTKPLEKPHP
jgi:hypothetical protein